MLLLQGFVFAILVFIAWQDFKYRAVYWWLFIMLLMALTGLRLMQGNWQGLLYNLRHNLLFLGVQLFFLTLYFSLKERRMVNVLNGYFGLGDLFFLLSITTYLSFFNYVIYYLLSLFMVIVVSVGLKVLAKDNNPKIPLAGEQALLLMIWMGLGLGFERMSLLKEFGIINYFG